MYISSLQILNEWKDARIALISKGNGAKGRLIRLYNWRGDNPDLKIRAKANSLDDFKFAVKNEFKDTVVKSYAENTEFYGRILNDEEFKEKVLDLLLVDIYNSLKNKKTSEKK